VGAPAAVAFLRAKLVESGVLDRRDEASARFAAWQATAVLRIATGTDRAHVRAYATWQVAHQLARTVARRGEASPSSIKYARSLVTEAINLAVWLHDQQLELCDLHQDLIDAWIAAGSRTRVASGCSSRGCSARASPAPSTSSGTIASRPGRRSMTSSASRSSAGCCTTTTSIRATGSPAACCLLYGQPVSRIAALRTTDIDTTLGGEITLRLGRGQIPLPEPLAQVAQTLRDQQLTRTGTDGWLLPGRHAGEHITAGTPQHRLKRYEIERSREGRHAALLALAARLPAPILAERLGIHQSRAAAWVRMAGATYADYVALRLTD
jgi:hypothetical protein